MKKSSLALGISWVRFFGGLMGGGKSYFAVQQIAHVLALGGTVHTNIKVKREGMAALILHRYGVKLADGLPGLVVWDNETDGAIIREWWKHTPRGTKAVRNLVVIDEAHDYFPAGIKKEAREASSACADVLRKTRHAFTEVILISQAPLQVSAEIRRLCNYWTFRDLGQLKVWGFQMPSRLVAIERFPDPSGNGKGKKMQTLTQKKDQRVFDAYESTQYADQTAAEVKPQDVQRVRSAWSFPRLKKRWILAALFVGYWLYTASKPGVLGDSVAGNNAQPAQAKSSKEAPQTFRKMAAPETPDPQRFAVVNRAGFTAFGAYELAFDDNPPNSTVEVVQLGQWSNNLSALVVAVAGNRLTLQTSKGKEYATIARRPYRGAPVRSSRGPDFGSSSRGAPLPVEGDSVSDPVKYNPQ